MLLNAVLEMLGVGLVPVYIGILAQPDRLLEHEMTAPILSHLGVGPERITQQTLLYWGSGLLLALFTVKLAYAPFLAWVRARYIQGIVSGLSVRLFDGYMRAPYAFHLSRNTSELMRNVNAECMQLGMRVLHPMALLLTQLLITLAIVALLVASIPDAALFALLVSMGFALPVVALLNRRIKRLALNAQDGRKQVIRAVQEGLGGVKELRLLGREAFFVERFRRALSRVLALQRFQQVLNVTLPVMMEWVSVAALLAVVLILFQVEANQGTVLSLAALFAVAMARLKGSVSGVLGAYTQVRASLVSVDVVDRDLRHMARLREADPYVSKDAAPMPARPQVLELKDVWYRYSGADDFALKGIDLSIQRGEAIGIVGPSGGGKSTLVDVILGILKPERGAVLADGVDVLAQVSRWHRLVGYVPQTVYLFDGTIRQNIALGLNDDMVDTDALANALRAANLEPVVSGLPQGLDTVVGERGVRFSGGQRQRIAIARALYNNPHILVMDEATSALDNLTEKAIMEAVDTLKGERTILIIAHRLTTVKNCDRIVFLQAGSIAGIDSYGNLAESNQAFKRQLLAG